MAEAHADYDNFSNEAIERGIREMLAEARKKFPNATDAELLAALNTSAKKVMTATTRVDSTTKDAAQSIIAGRLVWLMEETGKAIIELRKSQGVPMPPEGVATKTRFMFGNADFYEVHLQCHEV